MTRVPFVAISNEQLKHAPPLKAGDTIQCPDCGGQHVVEGHYFLCYACGEDVHMAGIDGRSAMELFQQGEVQAGHFGMDDEEEDT